MVTFFNDLFIFCKYKQEDSSKPTINTQKVTNEEKRLPSAASTKTLTNSSQVSGSKGGLAKLLNKIKNPPKLSTLVIQQFQFNISIIFNDLWLCFINSQKSNFIN